MGIKKLLLAKTIYLDNYFLELTPSLFDFRLNFITEHQQQCNNGNINTLL